MCSGVEQLQQPYQTPWQSIQATGGDLAVN
jgi:hypothetical protein